MPQA
jgi:hypothetical protein